MIGGVGHFACELHTQHVGKVVTLQQRGRCKVDSISLMPGIFEVRERGYVFGQAILVEWHFTLGVLVAVAEPGVRASGVSVEVDLVPLPLMRIVVEEREPEFETMPYQHLPGIRAEQRSLHGHSQTS